MTSRKNITNKQLEVWSLSPHKVIEWRRIKWNASTPAIELFDEACKHIFWNSYFKDVIAPCLKLQTIDPKLPAIPEDYATKPVIIAISDGRLLTLPAVWADLIDNVELNLTYIPPFIIKQSTLNIRKYFLIYSVVFTIFQFIRNLINKDKERVTTTNVIIDNSYEHPIIKIESSDFQ
jgi:hypothetical protein